MGGTTSTVLSNLKKKVDLTRLSARITKLGKRFFKKEPDSKNVLMEGLHQLYKGQNVTIETVWEIKGWVGVYKIIKND